MRFDLQRIASWIPEGASVLDLGCGAGELLHYLHTEKRIRGHGIEQSEENVAQCIGRGLSVVQGDMNTEILDYPDKRFDVVVLSQTLQQVYQPAVLLKEMLRVGRQGVVSFPNFSHWRIRAQLLLTGKAPRSRELPYEWWNTPNIRVITLKDFRKFCHTHNIPILQEAAIDTDYRQETGHVLHLGKTWRACYGMFLLGERHGTAPPS